MRVLNNRLFLIILSCLTILSVGCSSGNNLPLPEEYSEVSVADYYDFSSLSSNFETEFPYNWVQVSDDSSVTITESKTGSYISILRETYYPEINTYSPEVIASVYSAEGSNLQHYSKPAGNQLDVIISYTRNNVPITEYKHMIWTYKAVYYINYVSETRFSEQFLNMYERVCDTFLLLDQEETIQDDYECSYNSSFGVSIEYPVKWKYSDENAGFSVTNEQTGSVVYVEIASAIPEFNDLSQLDYYNNILKNVANDVSMTSYTNNGTAIQGDGYYTYGARKFLVSNILYDNTDYTLSVTYVSSADYAAMDREVFEIMLNSIRYYR